jgi:hypothetical protein
MLSPLATALRAALRSAEAATAEFPAMLNDAQRATRAVLAATDGLSHLHRLAGRVGGTLLSVRSLDLVRHRTIIVAQLRRVLGDVVEAEGEAGFAVPPLPVQPQSNVLAFRTSVPRYYRLERAR